MKKVLTLFCALMVTFLTVGVAKAQTTFQVSEAPSNGAWAENTKWYVVTLDNFIISSEALEFGNKSLGGAVAFSMSSKSIKDAIKDASLWCVVGDETNGYKFYNKAKGTEYVLALTNQTGNNNNNNSYGGSRAKLVASSTTSSTADNANGCLFDIKTKGANYPNIYCIKLHGTNNRYFNNRDNHLSYWDAPQAFDNSARGSQVRFYDYDTNGYCRVGLSSLLLPGVANDQNVSAAETKLSQEKTLANIEALESAITDVLATKYYRINNQRENGIKQLATDGSNTPKMISSNNANRLVNAIWQFTLCEEGVKMTNVNNPNGFVAALNDAEGNNGSVTNPLTTQEHGIKLAFSKFNNDYFAIKDGDGHLLNGENGSNGNYALCHWTTDGSWNNGNGRDGNQWSIMEASSIEVALNTLKDKSYASIFLPFGVSSIENATAYVAATPANGYVTFNPAEGGVAKQNGFLLVSDNAAPTATLNIGEGTATSQMTGTLTNLTLDNSKKANYRVFGRLSTDNNILGFFKPSERLNQVEANRGYFTNVVNEALRLNFSGVVSGIETIEANAQNNAPIFDLSGRRVIKTVKGGLYIQNGRKFIVK